MSEFVVIPKNNNDKVKTIFVDEEPWRDIHCSIFGYQKFEIKSIEQFELLEQKKVKSFVYKKLAQQNYSSHGLTKILKDFLVPKVLIQAVIQDCQDLGYINDEDWLKSFIRGAKAKKNGPRTILQKLLAKGFDKETASVALENEDSPKDRVMRIRKLLETRYKKYDLKDYKEKQKVVASLVRKGYSFEDILPCLSMDEFDHEHYD